MEKCIIAAIANNNGIGIANKLPWHIKDDLQYFKQVTNGYPIIMGKNTFLSFPNGPLPNRKNIILTHEDLLIDGVTCVKSLDEAFNECKEYNKCFIIGGASIYKQTIDIANKLYITHVDMVLSDADVFFPEINQDKWTLTQASDYKYDSQSGYFYQFCIYDAEKIKK